MSDPDSTRSTSAEDGVAVFGTLLVLPAGILRMASGDHTDYLMWAWILQGVALAFILLGILIGAGRQKRPSAGIWGVLVVWTLAAAHGLTYV
ncbi:hypothetical protein [Kitasatospora sp. McL0602]|uniref:hypothetical protein n=1 Tax=Kitasatospora sp. McL0602 TaxID=3439530 RepID=UPI003F8A6924